MERLNARVERLKARRPLTLALHIIEQTLEPALTIDLAIQGSVLLDSHVEKSLSVVQVDREVGSVIHQTSRTTSMVADKEAEGLQRKLVESQQRETALNGHILNYKKVVQSQNDEISRLQE